MIVDLRPGTVWRHRSGRLYTVVAHGVIEATRENAVIYRSHLGDDGTLWIRPREEFLDGRFELQE